jgi:hypothetical protein
MSTVNTKYKNYNLKIFIVYSFLLRCFHFRQEFSDHQVGGNHLSNGVALHPVNPNHSPRILIENRTIGLFIRPTDVQRRRRFNGWMASYMGQSSGRCALQFLSSFFSCFCSSPFFAAQSTSRSNIFVERDVHFISFDHRIEYIFCVPSRIDGSSLFRLCIEISRPPPSNAHAHKIIPY